MNIFLQDPNTNRPSATLTVWILISIVSIVMAVLECFNIGKTGSMLSEIFWGTGAMYLGRRFSFKGKNVEASSASPEDAK